MKLTTAQKFLVRWTREGRMVTEVNALVCHPKHGARRLRLDAKKRRRNAHARRMQRVAWCRYGEAMKREAA